MISFEGAEELSALSRFRLEVVTKGRCAEAQRGAGPEARGGDPLPRGRSREFHGMVSRFEVLRTSIRGLHLHLIELSPPAWMLTLNQRHRIFPHDKASYEIVQQVLGDGGPIAKDIKSIGDQREYWVQYGESDFNLDPPGCWRKKASSSASTTAPPTAR